MFSQRNRGELRPAVPGQPCSALVSTAFPLRCFSRPVMTRNPARKSAQHPWRGLSTIQRNPAPPMINPSPISISANMSGLLCPEIKQIPFHARGPRDNVRHRKASEKDSHGYQAGRQAGIEANCMDYRGHFAAIVGIRPTMRDAASRYFVNFVFSGRVHNTEKTRGQDRLHSWIKTLLFHQALIWKLFAPTRRQFAATRPVQIDPVASRHPFRGRSQPRPWIFR